jgi:hypothetical protein
LATASVSTVTAHVRVPLAPAGDGDGGRVCGDRLRLDGGGDDLVDGHVAQFRQIVGGLQPRQVHDARRELAEPRRLGAEATGEMTHLIGIVGGRLDRLREQAHRPTGVFSS